MQTGLAPVEPTCRQDGYVHFGDVLQLAHAHTGAVLVVDVSDKVSILAATVEASEQHECCCTAMLARQ